MTQYRQFLRLHSQGISQRSIAQSCGCSRNTVAPSCSGPAQPISRGRWM
ncbi:MAG: helix-turn-helix domain-containing protein [Oscillospiraceae bacterium]|nr:helix-turn-helix domain-containing protein [Oscillospiraceae bacterium]